MSAEFDRISPRLDRFARKHREYRRAIREAKMAIRGTGPARLGRVSGDDDEAGQVVTRLLEAARIAQNDAKKLPGALSKVSDSLRRVGM
ncbi:MAG TPA: hypothetical protein RMH99_31995 [Sandaracinaceae bacterium LLY-WYZ-13_1]|nr:hypothetical protein [Sandaracinaceae bacterium LLY-WYZ-13_1]